MPFSDPAFLAVTFVVIDFETLTPARRPAEPIEVAAIAGRFDPGGQWRETGRYESLMRPPADIPVTSFDIAMNGLTADVLRRERPAGEVMAELDAWLTGPPYRLVAHSAQTEAAAIGGQRRHCPALAATPLLCTVKLARIAIPDLRSHKLDELLRHLRIPRPPGRHRAMPDAEVTTVVFRQILAAGLAAGKWSALGDLDTMGGVRVRPEHGEAAEQAVLF